MFLAVVRSLASMPECLNHNCNLMGSKGFYIDIMSAWNGLEKTV